MQKKALETLIARTSHEEDVYTLYKNFLEAWNGKNARVAASMFMLEGYFVSDAGTHLQGPREIEAYFNKIFMSPQLGTYVAKIRGTQMIGQDAAIVFAAAGVVPPNQPDPNPTITMSQSFIAGKSEGQWKIACFQNTISTFPGQPEAQQKLIQELRAVLRSVEAAPAAEWHGRVAEVPARPVPDAAAPPSPVPAKPATPPPPSEWQGRPAPSEPTPGEWQGRPPRK